MSSKTYLKSAGALALVALMAGPLMAAADDDTAGQKTETTVMYLGKTPITGDANIFHVLQSIKVALMRPYSTKAADADLVVCRINRAMSEALEYLDCDFNRDYTQLRDLSQMSFMTAQGRAGQQNSQPFGETAPDSTVIFESLINIQPNHRLHIPINGGNLMKLLNSLPMPTNETVDSAPAPSTNGG